LVGSKDAIFSAPRGALVLAIVTTPMVIMPTTVRSSAYVVERRLRSLIHSMRAACRRP
jgi:hypothetical protein